MKAYIALSVRSALSLALGMLLSATVATGCDSDNEPDRLEISDEEISPTNEVTNPNPVIQCQNGVLVSVWTKVPSPGIAPAVIIGQNPNRQCTPTVDASADVISGPPARAPLEGPSSLSQP